MCHFGADAGTHVSTQGVRPKPKGLPENDALSKVAKNGRPARKRYEKSFILCFISFKICHHLIPHERNETKLTFGVVFLSYT